MLMAVEHIHEKGVIHRDIKLENFLISYENAGYVVKLCDFGLSKEITIGVPGGGKAKGKAGTYITMAPEMMMGQLYDSKIDCWALGVILYEMLTSNLPFYSDD